MSATAPLLSDPSAVMDRLAEIENDLASRQNLYEQAASRWFRARREIERTRARALLSAAAETVTEKKAHADLAAYDVADAASEAEYEALKAVIRVLEVRATIGMSILKAQGRS